MKNLIILLTFFSLVAGCKKDDIPEPLKSRSIGSEWITAKGGSGGYNNFDSFKNVQYNFEVGGNAVPVMSFTSSPLFTAMREIYQQSKRRSGEDADSLVIEVEVPSDQVIYLQELYDRLKKGEDISRFNFVTQMEISLPDGSKKDTGAYDESEFAYMKPHLDPEFISAVYKFNKDGVTKVTRKPEEKVQAS